SEIIRTGIEAVPKGQTEAALSQGFTYADTMRIIILPQAVRTILPPLTNQVVNLIKNTSTVAIISGADIMFTAKAWAYDTTNYVSAFAGAAFLYFIMCFPLATWARRKEEENKKAY
ncbi:amino acid ABC transporter permease, partial [Streptococcus salivarius]